MSYALGLTLAVIFGPLVYLECYLIPIFYSKYTPRLSPVLLGGGGEGEGEIQVISAWSQLLFALAMSVACFVRQYQPSCTYYESAMMTQVVSIVCISLALVLSSLYRPMKRMVLFVASYILTSTFAAFAILTPAATIKKFNAILDACINVAREKDLPWKDAEMIPYQNSEVFPEVFTHLAIFFAQSAMWFYLWLRRRDWIQEGKVKETIKLRHRILIILVFLLSLALLRLVCTTFYLLLKRRSGIIKSWGGETGEHAWGVGQIGAVFAWVPLLVDLGASALVKLKQRLRRTTSDRRRGVTDNTTTAAVMEVEVEMSRLRQGVADGNNAAGDNLGMRSITAARRDGDGNEEGGMDSVRRRITQ